MFFPGFGTYYYIINVDDDLSFTVGSMQIGNTTIYPVYFLPNGPRYLISTTQLEDHGLKIIHQNKKVLINRGDHLVFKFHRIGDLYVSHKSTTRGYDAINNAELATDWHILLGHPSSEYLNKFLSLNKLQNSSAEHKTCEICLKFKIKRSLHVRPIPSASSPFQKTHSDILQISPISSSGFKYVLVLIDGFSWFNQIFLLKKKSEAVYQILSFLMEFKAKTGKVPAYFHLDCGGKFSSNFLKTRFQELGINIEQGPADCPQSNGLAKRFNQSLIVKMQCIVAQSAVPIKLWDEATRYASFLINLLPSKPLSWKSLFNVLKNFNLVIKPICKIHKLIPFGLKCYVHRTKLSKINPPSQLMLFLGYETHSDAGWFLDPSNHHIIISCDYSPVPLNFKYDASSLKKTPVSLPSIVETYSEPASWKAYAKITLPLPVLAEKQEIAHGPDTIAELNPLQSPPIEISPMPNLPTQTGSTTTAVTAASKKGYAYVPGYVTAPRNISSSIDTENILLHS